jgi:hypothetical protein
VIDERVVRTFADRHRAHPPAGPEVVAHEQARDGLLALLRDDATPEEMPEVGGQRVDRALVPVEPEGVEAALLDPERRVEAASELGCVTLELVGQTLVPPDSAGDLGQAQLRVVDITLHLGGGDRRLGERPVVERHRVLRVLPRLVANAVRATALVFDEAVAVGVGGPVDPGQGAPRRLLELERESGVVGPAPELREEDEEERRGIDRPELLLEALAGERVGPLRELLPLELVGRGTTGPAPA